MYKLYDSINEYNEKERKIKKRECNIISQLLKENEYLRKIMFIEKEPININNINDNKFDFLKKDLENKKKKRISKIEEEIKLLVESDKEIIKPNIKSIDKKPEYNEKKMGKIKEDDIIKAASYRTKNRYPTLSYYYYKSGGSIWRSSQNKAGIINSRNNYDEKVLESIGQLSKINVLNKLIIFDARPYLSAYANKLKGAGFENMF